jgi:hypothetical protein
MAKTKRPLGEVKITRGETDDEALAKGHATWKLVARDVSATVKHPLNTERYEITAPLARGGETFAAITADDFDAVVAAARALMESVR